MASASPLLAQGQARIVPRPSPVLRAPAASPPAGSVPEVAVAVQNSLGIPTGAIIGGAGGLLLAVFYCGFRGGDSGSENCNAGPYLIGIFAGGVTGALIDGAFRD